MLHKFVLAVIAAGALAAQSQLNGKFIFSEEDTLGVIEFDGKGNVSGTAYKQLTGAVPFTGTYSIGGDGSGSVSLLMQTVDEEGVSAPAALAAYQFLQADAKGFTAMQTAKNAISVAKFFPAYAAKALSGSYVFESEGKSASGEARAEIGLVTFLADGNLSGKQIVKQTGAAELITITGTYSSESSGFWTIRLFAPGPADEDGQASIVTTTMTAVTASNGAVFALRRGTAQPGVVTFEPSR
jgi:carbon monoxide dehydrogenase subunit G